MAVTTGGMKNVDREFDEKQVVDKVVGMMNTATDLEAFKKEELAGKTKSKKKPTKKEVLPPSEASVPDPILGQEENIGLIETAVKIDQAVLLIGETGTGKTSIVKHIAARNGREWIRFNLTGETTIDEFVGKYTLKGGETVWQDGVLLTAMKKGMWLICDEINAALPEILFVLHSLLDDDRHVMVANHDGEVVKPHENFRFFATMNPVDEYAGTKELNKAFRSRFGMTLIIHHPSDTVEVQIITSRTGVSEANARAQVMVGNMLRTLKKENKIFLTVSTRDLIQWGLLARHIDSSKAFIATILNKSDSEDERSVIKNSVSKIMGTLSEIARTGNTQLDPEWFKFEFKRLEVARAADMKGMRDQVAREEKARIYKELMEQAKI